MQCACAAWWDAKLNESVATRSREQKVQGSQLLDIMTGHRERPEQRSDKKISLPSHRAKAQENYERHNISRTVVFLRQRMHERKSMRGSHSTDGSGGSGVGPRAERLATCICKVELLAK